MSSNPYEYSDGANEPGEVVKRSAFTVVELFVVLGIIAILVALFLPATRRGRPVARRTSCKNNLKHIALAMHNYADVYGGFPPAYTFNEQGRPLHSWRTLILPFLDQQTLYDSIDLSKPWDDPVNAAALQTQVQAYQCPAQDQPENCTTYLAIVGEDCCLRADSMRLISEITDGTSQTLMLMEFPEEAAIPWMKPQDAGMHSLLALPSTEDLPHYGGTQCVYADGHSRFLAMDETEEAELRAVASVAGEDDPGDLK